MQTVEVTIKGVAPLLMHRYPLEDQQEEKAKKRNKVYDPKEDAEKALYKNANGCFAPATWIESCLRDAGKGMAKGKGTYKSSMQSSVFVEPDEIPLGKETYDEIDRRPVVIQRNRVVRSRPKFNNWQMSFKINFDETVIHKDVLKDILTEAGKTKGIGDYRPKFGRFEVVEFN